MVGAEPEAVRRYLAGIGLGEALIDRTEKTLASVRRLLPDDPSYIFVSEYRDEEGNRNPEDLWVLTPTVISEVAQFVTESSFDLVAAGSGLSRVVVEREAFEFGEPDQRSRLMVEISFGYSGLGLKGTLKASGSNCGDLQQILEEYFVPLLSVSG